MLKFLLCSIMMAPCLVMTFGGSAKSSITSFKKISYEEAYIEPAFARLKNCEAVELDVFFHKNYLTSHSSEYIAEGIKISANCGFADFIIAPVVPSISYVNENDVLNEQTEELLLVLEAHGINAKVADAEYQEDFNSLTANGRTAKLKIAFNEGGSS